MKGVLLCGGFGTRLMPLTKVTNKHLLPVFNKPMIEYPLSTLLKLGLKEIIVVTGGEHIGDFANYLGSGKQYGCQFYYKVQDSAGGIGQALGLAETFCRGEDVAVILGDNIFEWDDSFSDALDKFNAFAVKGAMLFLKDVGLEEAKRFGVAEIVDDTVISIIEKPEHPASSLVQTGLYLYDKNVFDIIHNLQPSSRNEIEIADVSALYCRQGRAHFHKVNKFWTDSGTWKSLNVAWNWAYDQSKKLSTA